MQYLGFLLLKKEKKRKQTFSFSKLNSKIASRWMTQPLLVSVSMTTNRSHRLIHYPSPLLINTPPKSLNEEIPNPKLPPNFQTYMEEFQEEDILWPEIEDKDQEEDIMGFTRHSTNTRARHGTSVPIPIPSKGPVSHSWTAGFNYNGHGINMQDDDLDDDGDDYNGLAAGAGTLSKSMVPPHILVSRRYADKMPFSVCVGNGRKLKGREQRIVRNSILRLTGYLEK